MKYLKLHDNKLVNLTNCSEIIIQSLNGYIKDFADIGIITKSGELMTQNSIKNITFSEDFKGDKAQIIFDTCDAVTSNLMKGLTGPDEVILEEQLTGGIKWEY